MPTTRFTKQHTQSRLTTLHGTETVSAVGFGEGARKDSTPITTAAPRPPPTIRTPTGRPAAWARWPQEPSGARLSSGWPRPRPLRRLVLARVLSRPPARPPPPQARPQDTVSRPARSRCSAAGPTGESGPRARASRRQHPGKRRRRRLLGPRHLGPRPGPAGSRLSGRAGPPPTDRPPDGQEGRQEEGKEGEKGEGRNFRVILGRVFVMYINCDCLYPCVCVTVSINLTSYLD